jgi:ribonuclease-3
MLSGQALSEGTGKSKREAEQIAARAAYESLKTLYPQP